MTATRPSAGMTRIRFKGHRTTGYTGLPRYLSPAGGAPLGDATRCGGLGEVSNQDASDRLLTKCPSHVAHHLAGLARVCTAVQSVG